MERKTIYTTNSFGRQSTLVTSWLYCSDLLYSLSLYSSIHLESWLNFHLNFIILIQAQTDLSHIRWRLIFSQRIRTFIFQYFIQVPLLGPTVFRHNTLAISCPCGAAPIWLVNFYCSLVERGVWGRMQLCVLQPPTATPLVPLSRTIQHM